VTVSPWLTHITGPGLWKWPPVGEKLHMSTLLPSGVSMFPVFAVRLNVGPVVQIIPHFGGGGASAAPAGDAGDTATGRAPATRTSARSDRLRIRLTHHCLRRQRGTLVDPYFRGHPAQPG